MLDVSLVGHAVRRWVCQNRLCPSPRRLAMGHEFGSLLLQALGVDPQHVTGFTLDCNAGEPLTLTVRRCVFDRDLAALLRSVQMCKLSVPALPATAAGTDRSGET